MNLSALYFLEAAEYTTALILLVFDSPNKLNTQATGKVVYNHAIQANIVPAV